MLPKVLFTTLDRNMITVPACTDCNQLKGLGDRDLRNYVNLHVAGAEHPNALTQVGRMLSHAATSEWLRRSLDDAEEIDIKTNAGIILGRAAQFEFNHERFIKSLEMTVRGLYHHHTKSSLSIDSPILFREIPIVNVPATLRHFEAVQPHANEVRGDRIVQWIGWLEIEGMDHTNTQWLLCFNGGVWFTATTGLQAVRMVPNGGEAGAGSEGDDVSSPSEG